MSDSNHNTEAKKGEQSNEEELQADTMIPTTRLVHRQGQYQRTYRDPS